MRLLYSALLYLLLPAILMRWLWRSRRLPAYRKRWSERFGRHTVTPAPDQAVLWLHAVSVGEIQAARPLLEALLARYPDHCIALSTTTPTGAHQARALFGGRVAHLYAPLDTPGAVARCLEKMQPQLLVLIETELWPNLLHQCALRQVPVLLANARLSARSARGYGRIAGLTRAMLSQLAAVACQAEPDAERFLALGLDPERLRVTGNLKYDLALTPAMQAQARDLRLQWRSAERPVVLAASTHAGEETLLLSALAHWRRDYPALLLVIVPRHAERGTALQALAMTQGFATAARAAGSTIAPDTAVLIADTMGELPVLLGAATLVVIGGSWVPHGGQNPIEAARWSKPIICGPHMFNFTAVVSALQAAGGIEQVSSADDLQQAVSRLLADEPRQQASGAAAATVVARHRGATDRVMKVIATTLASRL